VREVTRCNGRDLLGSLSSRGVRRLSKGLLMSPWRVRSERERVKLAGLDLVLVIEELDVEPPATVRLVAVAQGFRVAHLVLTLVPKGIIRDREVDDVNNGGVVSEAVPPGTVIDVFVVRGFRGIGAARALWPLAHRAAVACVWGFPPRHSPSRTHEGQRYAEVVGGDIPPLAGGCFVEPSDVFDGKSSLWRGREHLDLEACRQA
jgi:hypothetical protein